MLYYYEYMMPTAPRFACLSFASYYTGIFWLPSTIDKIILGECI